MNNPSYASSLEDIRQQADAKRFALSRFLSPARLSPTATYDGSTRMHEGPPRTEFGSARVLWAAAAGGMAIFFFFIFINIPTDTLTGRPALPLPLLLATVAGMAAVAAVVILRLRQAPARIALDPSGITIDETFAPWSRVRETAILSVLRGKYRRRYLVLWYTDGQYETFELSRFASFSFFGFAAKLSSHIEYYKAAGRRH